MFIYTKKFMKIVSLEMGAVIFVHEDEKECTVVVAGRPAHYQSIFDGTKEECADFIDSLAQSMLAKGAKVIFRD